MFIALVILFLEIPLAAIATRQEAIQNIHCLSQVYHNAFQYYASIQSAQSVTTSSASFVVNPSSVCKNQQFQSSANDASTAISFPQYNGDIVSFCGLTKSDGSVDVKLIFNARPIQLNFMQYSEKELLKQYSFIAASLGEGALDVYLFHTAFPWLLLCMTDSGHYIADSLELSLQEQVYCEQPDNECAADITYEEPVTYFAPLQQPTAPKACISLNTLCAQSENPTQQGPPSVLEEPDLQAWQICDDIQQLQGDINVKCTVEFITKSEIIANALLIFKEASNFPQLFANLIYQLLQDGEQEVVCNAVGVLECWEEGGDYVASMLLDSLTSVVALVSGCDNPQTASQAPKGSPAGGSEEVADPEDDNEGKISDFLASAATNVCCQCHCSNNPWLTQCPRHCCQLSHYRKQCIQGNKIKTRWFSKKWQQVRACGQCTPTSRG